MEVPNCHIGSRLLWPWLFDVLALHIDGVLLVERIFKNNPSYIESSNELK